MWKDQTSAVERLIVHSRPYELALLLKWAARIGYEEREINGLKLWLDPASNFGYRLLRDGHYEPEMTELLNNLLKPGDTFIDLGGNSGWFSVLGGQRVGRAGRVLCIEPQERLWPVILRNLTFNSLDGHCHLIPAAVSDRGDRGEITVSPSLNTGSSSLVPIGRYRFLRRQPVVLRSLDRICKDYAVGRVNVVKVDVEGYELTAMRSAANLLQSKRIEHVVMEVHPAQLSTLGQSTEDLFRLMGEAGYAHTHHQVADVHHFSLP